MIRLALLIALPVAAWCVPCRAADSVAIGTPAYPTGPSIITLRQSAMPYSLGEVTLQNQMVNGDQDTGATTTLEIPGMAVDVTFAYNSGPNGADSITITPPEGVICVPSCVLMVPEGETGVVQLFSHEGVGS